MGLLSSYECDYLKDNKKISFDYAYNCLIKILKANILTQRNSEEKQLNNFSKVIDKNKIKKLKKFISFIFLKNFLKI